MAYENKRAIETPSHADFFRAVMVNLWEGNADRPKDEYNLDRFYDDYHNAVNTARSVFGATVEGPKAGHDDVLVVRFRDGSRAELSANGSGIVNTTAKRPSVASDFSDWRPHTLTLMANQLHEHIEEGDTHLIPRYEEIVEQIRDLMGDEYVTENVVALTW